MTHNNDKKALLKELWERFYQLCGFEIMNLWEQASIFTIFISLLFAGYGYIFLENFTSNLILKYAWSCSITTLAITFSIFWIAFAKGAKARIEVLKGIRRYE